MMYEELELLDYEDFTIEDFGEAEKNRSIIDCAISKIPTEKLHQLVIQAQNCEDEVERSKVRSTILRSMIPLFFQMCKKYSKRESDMEDLVAICLGNAEVCIDKWSPNKGAKFVSFACTRCRWRLGNIKIRRLDDICKLIPVSDNELTLSNISTKDNVKKERKEAIKHFLAFLDSRERYIVEQSYLCRRTARDLSKELGLSSEHFKYVKRKAVEKMNIEFIKERSFGNK